MAQESSKSLLEKLDELPAKAADKLTEFALKAYRAVSDKESLPANQKVFLDTFVDKNKGQITEKFFNEEELRAIGKMIASKGGEKGSIRYDDYASFMKPSQTSAKAGVLEAGANPYESVRTTLGQFNYRKDPSTQQYVVEDRYDFNRRVKQPRVAYDPVYGPIFSPGKKNLEEIREMSDYVVNPKVITPVNSNPYELLRLYAGRNMPEGQGRPVRVKVPKFAKGGEANTDDLVAPPAVVTPEKDPLFMNLKSRGYRQSARDNPPQTQSRNMLDQILAGRKEMTGTLPGIGADIAAGMLNPPYGVAASAADFEIARREGDLLGMGLSGIGMVPVVGPMLKGAGMAAPFLLGAVKPKGGNWLRTGTKLDVEEQLKYLKSTVNYRPPGDEALLDGLPYLSMEPGEALNDIESILSGKKTDLFGRPIEVSPAERERLTLTKDLAKRTQAMNKWIESNLTNYFKKQMSSPDDPLRTLAEEGRIPLDPEEADEALQMLRATPGTGRAFRLEQSGARDTATYEQLGQSEPAKAFELLTDSMIKGSSAGEIVRLAEGDSRFMRDIVQKNPWLTKVDPSTEVYSLRNSPVSVFAQMSGDGEMAPHLPRTFNLDHMMDVIRSDLQEGRLRPERLSQMSVADAYKRMLQYDDDMAKAAKEAELARSKALLTSTPVVQYQSGYRWVQLPDPESNSEAMKLVTDIGCRGGWCTRYEENARRYGGSSGGNELFVLLDEGGKPHLQVQTKKAPDSEARDILQMKPWSNSWASQYVKDELVKNPEYVKQIKPYLDDFVLNGDWREIQDLSNSGLFNVGKMPEGQGAITGGIRRISQPALSRAFDVVSDTFRDQPEALGQAFGVTAEQARVGLITPRELYLAYLTGKVIIQNSPGYRSLKAGEDTELTRIAQETLNNNPQMRAVLDFVEKTDEFTQSLRPPRKMAKGGEVTNDIWCPSFLYRNR